jgi:hypothetical protein
MLWAERQVPWALPFMLQCSRSSLGGVWGRMSVQELGDELERNLQDSSGSDEFLNFSRDLVTVAQCKNCFPLNVAVLSAAVSSCSPPPTTSQQTLSQGSMALTQGDSSARSLLCSLCLLWVWKEGCSDQQINWELESWLSLLCASVGFNAAFLRFLVADGYIQRLRYAYDCISGLMMFSGDCYHGWGAYRIIFV